MMLAWLPQLPELTGPLAIPPMGETAQRNLLTSAVVVLLLLFARRGVLAFISKHVDSQPLRYRWSKSTAAPIDAAVD